VFGGCWAARSRRPSRFDLKLIKELHAAFRFRLASGRALADDHPGLAAEKRKTWGSMGICLIASVPWRLALANCRSLCLAHNRSTCRYASTFFAPRH
jgi:hypothetical protein